jgi:hypothetical protein
MASLPLMNVPEVVVAREVEDLAAFVDELGVKLEGEVEIVGVAFVAETLAVDGEEGAVVVGVHVAVLGQAEGERKRLVGPCHVAIPLVEVRLGGGVLVRLIDVDRLLVATQRGLDDALLAVAGEVLEIRVAHGEVADGARELEAAATAAAAAAGCRAAAPHRCPCRPR